MAKFNALGSNFTLGQAWRTLWWRGKVESREVVKQQVRELLGDAELQVEFFYKGREALRVGLRSLNLPPGSRVGVVGFTCVAVIEAIEAEGLAVELLEIDETANIDVERIIGAPNNLKALIIQNTFGFSQRKIKQLIDFCATQGIVLIEDGAHCFGARYKNGQLVGTLGRMAFFSSSQDKILDSVSGGLLVSRGPLPEYESKKISADQQRRDRRYPLLTWLIRHTYGVGVGKALHWLVRRGRWLSRPMSYDDEGELHDLPDWQIELLGEQLARLEECLARRRENLARYEQNLASQFWLGAKKQWAGEGIACLRLPILVGVDKREEILRALRKKGYYLTDFWYDAPVGTKKCLEKYRNGQAIAAQFSKIPRAVEMCERILNLPLHQEMTTRDIKRICEIVQG